jgi:hypothetical protein
MINIVKLAILHGLSCDFGTQTAYIWINSHSLLNINTWHLHQDVIYLEFLNGKYPNSHKCKGTQEQINEFIKDLEKQLENK